MPGLAELLADSPCGGAGTCGKCRVMVLNGDVSSLSPEEQLWLSPSEMEEGIRLACFCQVKGEIRLGLPEKTATQILSNTGNIKRIFVKGFTHKLFGMAVDLGTTSVVGSLFNMNTGEEINTSSRLNPQCSYGLDIMSRIDYASRDGGIQKLNRLILDCLDELVIDNCSAAGIKADDIQEIVIAGNTVMLHLLAGINPAAMGRFPYTPVFTSAMQISAAGLGMKAPCKADVYLMPSASAFIGSDIVGGILATGLHQEQENCFLLDLGTNGEMVLFSKNQLYACSVAVGPALEGMNIECGMRSEAGAIDKVWTEGESLCFHTIGEKPARGLCGSGLIEAAGVMWNKGLLAANGKILTNPRSYSSSIWAEFITEKEKNIRFCLIPCRGPKNAIFISQHDIRQLQLAKAAICAGIKLLMDAAKIEAQDVYRVNLAGALGNYVNYDLMIELGFFPSEWRGKIRPAGNSALLGATMVLMSTTALKQADEISKRLICLDLASTLEFQDIFVRGMALGSTG
ncbi:ASKHA domain-containing protein [Syntrophomonas palmitatica]|uniref:ASKHA domain-containing protein n=1 Tax=Syntrophomonas palmitatica TaxID=402877 RepID=UPI001A9A45ED|nr:ASKHA domain-containing protein [Syntrophomonas palmitatica]